MQILFTNLVIFSIIGMGWLLKKVGRITPAGLKDINALLFMPLMPITFFSSALDFNIELLKSWRYVKIVLCVYVISTIIICTWASLRKQSKERRAVSILAGNRPNCIFIALPLMTMWLGQAGADNMLMYIACCMPYFNIVPLVCSLIALRGRADKSAVISAFIGTFTNPIMICGILGLLVGAFGWTPLIPQWIMRVLKLLGTTSTGLALISIGAALVPETLIDDVKAAWPDITMKLMIHPAIMLTAFILFPIDNATTMQVAVAASAVAPAFNCYVIANGFGMDGDYAATLVASSTLVSMLTLMFWMTLATHLFA